MKNETTGIVEPGQARHAAYFARLAMQAYAQFNGPEGARWIERITDEQDNLRAAFRWATGHGEQETALQLAAGVWRYHCSARKPSRSIAR